MSNDGLIIENIDLYHIYLAVCNRKCHSETCHREVNQGKIMHLFMSCGISGKTGHFCQRQCVCNLHRYSRLISYPLPDPPFPLLHNGVKLFQVEKNKWHFVTKIIQNNSEKKF